MRKIYLELETGFIKGIFKFWEKNGVEFCETPEGTILNDQEDGDFFQMVRDL